MLPAHQRCTVQGMFVKEFARTIGDADAAAESEAFFASAKILENTLLAYKNELLREQFIFDYYKNEIKNEIKIGFRFVFQSPCKTITDEEVNNVVDDIIKLSLKIDSVSIPGLKNGN